MDEYFKQAALIENDRVKKWKKDGGRVVGYACVLTPVEILEAAGVLPYRIRALGHGRTDLADAHLSRFNCSYCRSCLQLGLDGAYDFLDGLVETNGCDHIRGMFENWQYVKPSEFFHYVRVPHIVDEDSRKFFAEDIALFRQAVAKHFDVQITDEKLLRSIETSRRIRKYEKEIYQMRAGEEPALTGAEAMALFLYGCSIPAEEFADILKKVIDKRLDYDAGQGKARLMLCGSATDEVDFLKAVEDVGAVIVADALCFGWRAVAGDDGSKTDDPAEALASIYLDHILCPRMFDEFAMRRDLVVSAARDSKVDGVILVHNKFCDVHGVDNVQLRMALENEGIPALQLEKEYGAKADIGRLKTRIQAFLERIGN